MQPQTLTFNPNDTANANLYLGNGTYTTSSPNVGQIDELSSGTLSTYIPASPATVLYPSDLTFDAFGNLWGTSLYERYGFIACVIATTLVYACILPVILLIPRSIVAGADEAS